MTKLEVDVEVTTREVYRALFRVVETDRRYVILESSDGHQHTLNKGDTLNVSWDTTSTTRGD